MLWSRTERLTAPTTGELLGNRSLAGVDYPPIQTFVRGLIITKKPIDDLVISELHACAIDDKTDPDQHEEPQGDNPAGPDVANRL